MECILNLHQTIATAIIILSLIAWAVIEYILITESVNKKINKSKSKNKK